MDPQKNIGKPNYITIIPTVIVAALSFIPLILFDKESAAVLSAFFNWFKNTFGTVYLLLSVASLGLCLWLAFSKFGKIRFGAPDEKPEFSTKSWMAMLFCTGVAGGVLYWSIAEPIYYSTWPPLYADPFSTDAFLWAGTYTFFHWGPVPWSFFIICSIPIGYSFFIRKNRFLRVSSTCTHVFPEKMQKPTGVVLDVLFAVGLLICNISIAAFTIPMVSESFSKLTGLTHSYTMELTMMTITAVIFCTSSFLGLEKGIARLSSFNVWIGIIMVVYVFCVGPSTFLLDNFVNGVGNMFQNLIRLMTWTDPHTKGTFPQDWTMFYWAYWIAYAPLTGLFIARISRGRTIRQIILQGICFGMLGAWCIHASFGGYTLYLQVNDIANLSDIMQKSGISYAIVSVLETLPFKEFVMLGFCVFSIVFFATSLDSSALAIAISCTDNTKDEMVTPSRVHTLMWAIVLAIIPAGLLKVGGIDALKATVNVSAIPITILCILMLIGLFKYMKQDYTSGHLEQYFNK